VTDLRAWANRLSDASLRQLANLREPQPSRRWPLLGMFALGLVAGAIGSYAVTQRSQFKRLAELAFRMKDEALDESGEVEETKPVSVTTHRLNHRRKAVVEVKQ